MTVNLYFIRHGDPDYEHDSLTELGHRQAELTSLALKDIPFDLVFFSPIGRAQVTGRYLTDKIHKEPIVLPFVSEAVAWHAIAMYSEELKRDSWIYQDTSYLQKLKELQNDDNWYNQFPPKFKEGIETINNQIDEWLLTINIKHDRKNKTYTAIGDVPKNIIIFAHEGAGTRFICSILDLNYAYFITNYPRLDCCSINQFEINCDGKTPIKIIKYNDSKHLKTE